MKNQGGITIRLTCSDFIEYLPTQGAPHSIGLARNDSPISSACHNQKGGLTHDVAFDGAFASFIYSPATGSCKPVAARDFLARLKKFECCNAALHFVFSFSI